MQRILRYLVAAGVVAAAVLYLVAAGWLADNSPPLLALFLFIAALVVIYRELA